METHLIAFKHHLRYLFLAAFVMIPLFSFEFTPEKDGNARWEILFHRRRSLWGLNRKWRVTIAGEIYCFWWVFWHLVCFCGCRNMMSLHEKQRGERKINFTATKKTDESLTVFMSSFEGLHVLCRLMRIDVRRLSENLGFFLAIANQKNIMRKSWEEITKWEKFFFPKNYRLLRPFNDEANKSLGGDKLNICRCQKMF